MNITTFGPPGKVFLATHGKILYWEKSFRCQCICALLSATINAFRVFSIYRPLMQ